MISHAYISHRFRDDWNRGHFAKRAVLPEEVEEVATGMPVIRETYKQRPQLIGPRLAGLILTVVAGQVPYRPGVDYIFSARPASRKERQFFVEQKGGSNP